MTWLRLYLAVTLTVCAAIGLSTACRKKGPPANFGSGPIVVATATPQIAALEHKMHARLNRDRGKRGLKPLVFDSKLADIARAHSKDMHELSFFSHDSPRTGSLQDRLDRAGYLVQVARENLGEGRDVDHTQEALLESPGHYANIVAEDVTHVGVGILKLGTKQSPRLLVTQVFATPAKKHSPGAARAIIARRINEARRSSGLAPLPAHPLLDRLAKKHIDSVTDGHDASVAGRIGDAVTEELKGSKLSGVTVGTSLFVSADGYEPRGAPVAADARAIGIATAPGTDERGRPAVKALFLVGH